MKIGLLADAHVGYFHGLRSSNGVNVREQDVISSFEEACQNLTNEGVEAILDLGDLADVPSPRKRAIAALIRIINETGLPFYSVNGNHTLTRSKIDIHLYDLLSSQCPKFHGFTESGEALGGWLIPYADREGITRALEMAPPDFGFIAGHWACSDVPYPGDHLPVAHLPTGKPTFLGHYHRRTPWAPGGGTYLGATDRFSWGEWENPTGAAVYEDGKLRFIDHQVRDWVNIVANSDTYLQEVKDHDIEGAIVRLSIEATSEQYQTLDLVSLRKELAPSLEYQIRRSETGINDDQEPGLISQVYSIEENWKAHMKSAKMPRGVKRKDVESRGLAALSHER